MITRCSDLEISSPDNCSAPIHSRSPETNYAEKTPSRTLGNVAMSMSAGQPTCFPRWRGETFEHAYALAGPTSHVHSIYASDLSILGCHAAVGKTYLLRCLIKVYYEYHVISFIVSTLTSRHSDVLCSQTRADQPKQ